MAKKKNIQASNDNSRFQEFQAQLPQEIRNMLDKIGITSYDDVLNLAMILGIDIDKFEAYTKKNGKKLPSLEEVAFDEDDPRGETARFLRNACLDKYDDEENEDLDDEDYDYDEEGFDYDDFDEPNCFPKVCFIPDEKVLEYHMRIKLNDAPVPVWREVKVPSNITMELFAYVIQDVMGWEHEHLYQFRDKETYYRNKAQIALNDDMFGFYRNRTLVSEEHSIAEVFRNKGQRIKFEYDFGDSWEHDVWMKSVNEYTPEHQPGFYVLKGQGACPPEDCGGVWGYCDLLEINKKKQKTSDEKERLKWYDISRKFDENLFDINYARELLNDIWLEANNE